jgi:hypothetical protein
VAIFPDQASEIVKTIGLVVAGLWTAWTFHRLQKERAAEIANNKQLAETEQAASANAETMRKLASQQPVMKIDLQVSEHGIATEKSDLGLSVQAHIKNEGQQDFVLQFDDIALTVARVEPSFGERPMLKDVKHFGAWYFNENGKFEQIETRRFRAGSARHLALATFPVSKGVYFIQFQASYYQVPFVEEPPRDGQSKSEARGAYEQMFYFVSGSPLATSQETDARSAS